MQSTKRCTKCGEVKSLDEFHRDRSKPLGRRSRCRSCQRIYDREYNAANRDRRREYFREYYAANRDRYREYFREYYAANRDRKREYVRTWREANRDRHREYNRTWREANRDRHREYNRTWREANRDRSREYARTWREANRDRHREAKHRRRARKRSTAVEEFSLADVYAWWEEIGAYTCFWCDLPFTEDDCIHVDHVWPLSRGGHHAVRNLVPACERCNQAKHASLPHEFEERAYEEWLALTSE